MAHNKKQSPKVTILTLSGLFILLSAISTYLYIKYNIEAFKVISISLFTTTYHFIMRLLIAFLVDLFLHNKINYAFAWFREFSLEYKIYKLIKIKSWKDKMPTYCPEYFDPKHSSWEEIIMATCQSEIGHEIFFVLSFAPILASIWFSAIEAFVITSIISALMELAFIFMQRFNRHRIIKLIKKIKVAPN